MSKFKYCIYIVIFITFSSTCASANNKAIDFSSVIQVKDNLLTVRVKDMSLKSVLKEIAKQEPIKFSFLISAEELIVSDFSGLPLKKGLEKLLRNYNYAISYGTEKPKDKVCDIRKVFILSYDGKSRHGRSEPAITGAEETSLAYLSKEPYDKDLAILEEDPVDPLEDSEPTIATTGGEALGSSGGVPYDAEMDVRDKEMDVDILRDELKDEEDGVRLMAVEILEVIGGEKAIQVLQSALSDEDEIVRELAAQALSRMQEEG